MELEDLSHLIIGIIASISFYYRNTQDKFKHTISILLLSIFTIWYIIPYLPINTRLTLLILVGLTLLIFYTFRFINKDKRGVIEGLKLLSILLISVNPIILLFSYKSQLLQVINFMTIPFVGIIYVYDRFILNPKNMKRTFKIILLGQTILILLFLLYAFQQKTEADIQKETAVKMQMSAIDIKQECNELKQELENCRGNNN